MEHWQLAAPGLKPELDAAGRMLREKRGISTPVGDRRETAGAFTDFWESMESVRIIMASLAECENSPQGHFDLVLEPDEALSFVGNQRMVVWLGSDATMSLVGTIDFPNHIYTRFEWGAVALPLSQVAGWGRDSRDLISLAEFAGVVCAAAAWGGKWGRCWVRYAGDNTNVVGRIRSRADGNKCARFFIRLLTRLEQAGGFNLLLV